jgi:methylmalonyl-CoA mutase, N-terminal domain
MQMERLKAMREQRNINSTKERLDNIYNAANDGSNLMPHVIDAVEHNCTLGEIADVLRKVFGEYK